MTALDASVPLWQVSFAGRRFNVAHRILLTGIASQAAACKQSLRILLRSGRIPNVRYSFEGVDNRRRFDLSPWHPGQDPWWS